MSRGVRPAGVLVGVALAAVAAGCGNSRSPRATLDKPPARTVTVQPDRSGVERVTIDAGDDFRFDPSTVVASPGLILITLRNVGQTPHDLTFLGRLHAGTPPVDGGASATLRVRVSAPGRYEFVCTFHASLGMVGYLVVR